MTCNRTFIYFDGTQIKTGDRLIVDKKRRATVKLLLQPHTDEAKFWQCNETGGVLIDFEDGDCWLCRDGLDEDFQKIL